MTAGRDGHQHDPAGAHNERRRDAVPGESRAVVDNILDEPGYTGLPNC